jgi:hypothetical protein
MASVPAIRVNDEKNVVDHATDHLDSDLAIFTTIVQPLQCGTQEDPRGIFEVEAAFVKVAPAFGFVPLEEHRRMYALSVVRSSPRPPIDAAVRVSRSIVAVRHERFVPQAEQLLLRSLEASEGHPAVNYLEIEELVETSPRPSGKFLALPGGMQVKPLTKK